MEQLEDNQSKLMDILKPIVIVNKIMGICPHIVNGEILVFRLKSVNVFRTILSLIILTLYFIFLSTQFVLSFRRNRPMIEKVHLALWVGGSLLPCSMIICTLIKRNKITFFFTKMAEYKIPLKNLIKCKEAMRYSRRLYTFHIAMTIMGCVFVTNLIIRNPKVDISILAYIEGEPSSSSVALACCFQCYIVIIKSCAIAFIEVLCSSLAKCFTDTIWRINAELQKGLEKIQQNNKPFNPSSGNKIKDVENYKNMDNHPYVKKVNAELYTVVIPFSGENENGHDYHGSGDESANEGAGPILLAIKRFNCFANMQRMINCIFGTLLAIDCGFLIFMSCLLLFLQINYMGAENVDEIDVAIFTGNSLAIFIRILILFLSLGSVFETCVCFNGILASSLMEVKKPKSMEVNLILAHLSVNSSNPNGFSAGFFIFTKSSLLAVMSGIMTYAVFLLQAKN